MSFHLDEPLGIDPCVDIVFLWLFGAEEHEIIRLDFLNAILAPDKRIVRARVVNPVHPGSFEGQAGIRLDIQVTDENGRTFQIEMQRQRHRGLDQHMLYGWARLYSEQLTGEKEYHQLQPVISIWICEQDAFPSAEKAHLRFKLQEVDERFSLHDDIRFDVVQLSRVLSEGTGLAERELGAWCRLLKEAARWTEIPSTIAGNPALEKAMDVLNEFRVDKHLNTLYRGRLEYERVRRSEIGELEDERAARAAAEAALREKDAEIAALRAQLISAKARMNEG
jgi:predicted transposase/invertase (TIGR01784 family)